MAATVDENSASDGDIFPHMFREAALGPLTGITKGRPVIDRRTVNVRAFGPYTRGEWISSVTASTRTSKSTTTPKSVIPGRDASSSAVAEVLKRLAAAGVKLPAKPAGPVNT